MKGEFPFRIAIKLNKEIKKMEKRKVNVEININEALDIHLVLRVAYKNKLIEARHLINLNEIRLGHHTIRECKSLLKMIKAINF